MEYWKDPKKTDPRARYFFCHLGPPYENDAIAIRQTSNKVIVRGGLAQPWTPRSSRGSAQSIVSYNLEKDPYEKNDFSEPKPATDFLVDRLLQIHNQGYSRKLNIPPSQRMIIDDGWHNLRNDITGLIGFEFKLHQDQIVTHLGMWDDHDRELPIRSARSIPTDQDSDQPSRSGKKPRNINAKHSICLWKIENSVPKECIAIEIGPNNQGILEDEFRYFILDESVHLSANSKFLLTMSTTAQDGDHFHDPVSFDGLSPLTNSKVKILRNVMFQSNFIQQPLAIPSFADLDPQYSTFRIPVGPTLKFK